ncbi:MAG: undecaprenyldiphospho-muramoylpentapeptide beta-N-acetylglucosaminyltransferase [Acidimicrobiia bacterium]|nr:undecaprenyldiphospho-muramoylpentapeptide beta-N-acetylglucosaminyltransferase [Acidimicrobiia bacterium]
MSREPLLFVMAAGGTGGHIIPALAVANLLRTRGHRVLFVGTREGMEARLAQGAGYEMEWVEIGGLQRVGFRRAVRTFRQLPVAVVRLWRRLRQLRPGAVFSTGGFVAGPVIAAAWLAGIPVVAMEPNAMPGLTHRMAGRMCRRVLLGSAAAARFFPAGRSEVTGIPVREEFFAAPPASTGPQLRVLITGGSQGSRTLNQAFQQSWPQFRQPGSPVQFLHQSGKTAAEDLGREFALTGLSGQVTPFIDDMAAAFAAADLVVCRAGASTVAELAASGRPSILVPFPFATDDHQRHNAEAMERAGAARVVADRDLDGRRLHQEITALAADPVRRLRMAEAARALGRPEAARRAAGILEEQAGKTVVDLAAESRNNTR